MQLIRLMPFFIILAFIFLIFIVVYQEIKKEMLVSTINNNNLVVKKLKQFDLIDLKDGVCNNVEFVFNAKGTSKKPITLKAEDPGKVFIQGMSNLKIGKEYLIVKDFNFRNGYYNIKINQV